MKDFPKIKSVIFPQLVKLQIKTSKLRQASGSPILRLARKLYCDSVEKMLVLALPCVFYSCLMLGKKSMIMD